MIDLLEYERKKAAGEIEVINITEKIKTLKENRFHYLVINGHLIREDKFYILCFITLLIVSVFIFLLYKNRKKIKNIIFYIIFNVKKIFYFIKKKNMKITLIHVLLLIIIILLIILCFK